MKNRLTYLVALLTVFLISCGGDSSKYNEEAATDVVVEEVRNGSRARVVIAFSIADRTLALANLATDQGREAVAERADEIDVRGPADAADLSTETLGQLHRVGSDAARGANDQHTLAGPKFRSVAQEVERRGRSINCGGCLSEGRVARLGEQ